MMPPRIGLPLGLKSAALETAAAIAQKLSDPATAWANIPPNGGRVWPQSLAGGATGIALLHISRARTGHGDWSTARTWLEAATRDPLTAAANAGLYIGAPALAFVTHLATAETGHYVRTLACLDDAVIEITRRRLADARDRIEKEQRPELKEFDLIRGLAGLGAYHLQRHPDHPITSDVLIYLARLTEPLPSNPDTAPWWTDLAPSGEQHPDFLHGHANLGVAHGIGAVLALLSLAILQELPVPAMDEAAARICDWTDRWRQDGT